MLSFKSLNIAFIIMSLISGPHVLARKHRHVRNDPPSKNVRKVFKTNHPSHFNFEGEESRYKLSTGQEVKRSEKIRRDYTKNKVDEFISVTVGSFSGNYPLYSKQLRALPASEKEMIKRFSFSRSFLPLKDEAQIKFGHPFLSRGSIADMLTLIQANPRENYYFNYEYKQESISLPQTPLQRFVTSKKNIPPKKRSATSRNKPIPPKKPLPRKFRMNKVRHLQRNHRVVPQRHKRTVYQSTQKRRKR